MPASAIISAKSACVSPSNTGVATLTPNFLAAIPKWISKICPIFIREGTPSGFNMISIGVPSAMYGISSLGRILEITPLLPCLPAILSPSLILRFLTI